MASLTAKRAKSITELSADRQCIPNTNSSVRPLHNITNSHDLSPGREVQACPPYARHGARAILKSVKADNDQETVIKPAGRGQSNGKVQSVKRVKHFVDDLPNYSTGRSSKIIIGPSISSSDFSWVNPQSFLYKLYHIIFLKGLIIPNMDTIRKVCNPYGN